MKVSSALLAIVLLFCSRGARAADSVPDENTVRLAVIVFDRGTWHFEGSISGPTSRDQLAMSLSGDSGGTLAGEALLLTSDRRVLAVSAVSGRTDGTGCRLQFPLGNRIEIVDGICSPNVVAGRLVSSPQKTSFLDRLVFWWDDRDTVGEAWLAPSAGF